MVQICGPCRERRSPVFLIARRGHSCKALPPSQPHAAAPGAAPTLSRRRSRHRAPARRCRGLRRRDPHARLARRVSRRRAPRPRQPVARGLAAIKLAAIDLAVTARATLERDQTELSNATLSTDACADADSDGVRAARDLRGPRPTLARRRLFFTRSAKLAGTLAVRGQPSRHPGRGGTGCAASARAVADRGGGAGPSTLPG
jgi:hypothetical protein